MRFSAVFEEDVRRIARDLFPQGNAFGPVIIDGRERDSVINTGETIHIIEATRLTKKDKAKGDLEKSIELKKLITQQFPDHNFRIWFITEQDPTAEQAAEAEAARKKARCPVSAMSLNALMQRFINSGAYMDARLNHPFGSVRNPDSAHPNRIVPLADFIPIDLISRKSGYVTTISTLCEDIQNAQGIFVLLGDFGCGKSMTLRHVYNDACTKFRHKQTRVFPVFLNLREHVGQDEPSSALFDHGTRIGFSNPEQLVRAWKAGFIHIFLDGFDEISSSRFRDGAQGLRTVRLRAMSLIRKFIELHPEDTSILISGRLNYFSSDDEMIHSLGLSSRHFEEYNLSDFNMEQIQTYLGRLGLGTNVVPGWLPSRPLLLGYLATKGYLRVDGEWLTEVSPAAGWNYLLDQICDREGRQIDDLGGQTNLVRTFIDRLATRARATISGRGPLNTVDMTDLFRQVFPSSPDQAAEQLLVRLAGMASAGGISGMTAAVTDQTEAREFVDDDIVDTARAGDVVRYVRHPYDDDLGKLFSDRNVSISMGELGVDVAALRLEGISSGQINAALKYATQDLDSPALAFDLLRIMTQLNIIAVPQANFAKIFINNGYFPILEISNQHDMSKVEFRECWIGKVIIDGSSNEVLRPTLSSCIIDEVEGVFSRSDLPQTVFHESSEVAKISKGAETNAEVRQQTLPQGVKVLIVCLRKLFLQPGTGRKENAFFRGLSESEKTYVSDILDLIARHEFAAPVKLKGPDVWMPNKLKKIEAVEITQSPQQSSSQLLLDAKKL